MWLLIGLLAFLVWHRGNVIDKLERKIKGWDAAVQTIKETIDKNAAAIADCEAVNLANKEAADEQSLAALGAVTRVAGLWKQADKDLEDIYNEAERLRGTDTTCRTLDDPLPDDFLAGVRKPTP